MRAARNLRLSATALATHRLRTSLAVAGTAIGVAGVLVLTAIGRGASARVVEQIDALGGELLMITPTPVDGRTRLLRGGAAAGRSLRRGDAEALARGSSAIVRVVPAVDANRIANAGSVRHPTTVTGTTTSWPRVRRFGLAEGRFFTMAENSDRARVAVLGADARASLFPDSADPVGRTIRIGAVPFVVVGVLAAKGLSASGTATEDDRIVVPLETAMRRLAPTDRPAMILVEAVSADSIAAAAAAAGDILRARHDIPPGERDDFIVQSQRAVATARMAARSSFGPLLFGLGLLSLLVATVGIVSVMLLSVHERRREIGLRVAVGARRGDLAIQFFAESIALAATGAALGIPAGAAAAAAVSRATAWDVRVSGVTLLVAAAAAIAAGAGAGALPALEAASLDPVDALRSD